MISVQSVITGKEALYGEIEEAFLAQGFVLGGNWDFDGGYFDAALDRDEAETIYLRIPVQAVDGDLDDPGARLRFGQPLLVRHVVQGGNASDSLPLVDQIPPHASAFVNQFQTPVETDGEIKDQQRRIQMAQKAIERIIAYVH